MDRSSTTAIGDFVSKDAAHKVMNAILAVAAVARNAIHAQYSTLHRNDANTENARHAADWLDDMINQSSNDQRV